jgi:LmbE family N-acetylglucosaminyl deacetylase
VTGRRHAEDQSFADALGLRLDYLGLPDATLRPKSGRESLFAREAGEAFAAPAELEPALLTSLSESRPSYLLAPLGLGCHRDHLLLQRAAPSLAARAAARLAYYEDLPYAAALSRRQIARHARAVDRRLVPQAIPIGDALERKVGALQLYPSQIGRREIQAVRLHAWRPLRWLDRRRAVEQLWMAAATACAIKS